MCVCGCVSVCMCVCVSVCVDVCVRESMGSWVREDTCRSRSHKPIYLYLSIHLSVYLSIASKVMLGVGYAAVAAALWPMVAMLVPPLRLGTAMSV
jgi:hypothetical protein